MHFHQCFNLFDKAKKWTDKRASSELALLFHPALKSSNDPLLSSLCLPVKDYRTGSNGREGTIGSGSLSQLLVISDYSDPSLYAMYSAQIKISL